MGRGNCWFIWGYKKMNYLADTHILIWAITDSPKLSQNAHTCCCTVIKPHPFWIMICIYSVNTLYYMYHNMVIFKIPPSFYVLALLKGNDEEKALFLSLRGNRMAVRSIEVMVKKYCTMINTNKKITFSCVFFKGTIFAARFRLSLVISA